MSFEDDRSSEGGGTVKPHRDDNGHNSGGGDADTNNIQVICRVRPFSKRELDLHAEESLATVDPLTAPDGIPLRSVVGMSGQTTTFLDPDTFQEKERFLFDHSLWSLPEEESPNPFASQDTVMRTVGAPALEHVWTGFNTCVFAYGQTGSGKTFTMMGTDDEPGLIPTMCQELFKSIEVKRAEELEKRQEGVIREFRLEARFMEIYNDRVKDLLWALRPQGDSAADGIDRENLKVRNLPSIGPVVVGLTSVVVDKWADCLQLIEEGTKNRSVAATKMNETSSRSHSIFRLRFVQTTNVLSTKAFERPKSFDKVSNVCLVDLAGSERNKKTGAQGDRLKEAVAINKSLTSLKNVIDALVEGRPVIPYRDSQLTFLLSDSLGGNSKTFMIACVSPHKDNADETLNTLRYALRAQGIVCHATVNESDELRRMNELRQELELLRQMKEEPKEEGDVELRKEHQVKRDRLDSIRNASAQQQEAKEELQRDVALGAAFRSNTKYQSAFRVVLARRVEGKVRARCEELVKSEPQLAETLAEKERALRKRQSELTVASKVEADSRVLLKAREKELDTLRAKASALEWRKRSLMKQEEQLRKSVEVKANMKPWTTFFTKLMVAARAHHHQQQFVMYHDEQAALLKKHFDEVEEGEAHLKVLRLSNLDDLRASIRGLEASLAAIKGEQAEGQQSYAQRIQALHAECIFLEAETKEAAEELEKNLSAINKSRTTAFFALKEEWSTKFQRTAIEKDKELALLHDNANLQFERFESEEAKTLQDFVTASESALAEIVERSSSTVHALAMSQQEEENRLDALNREAELFLLNHARNEPRYKPLVESLFRYVKAAPPLSTSNVFKLLFRPTEKAKAMAVLHEELATRSLAEGDTKVPQRRLQQQSSAHHTTAGSHHHSPNSTMSSFGAAGQQTAAAAVVSATPPARKYIASSVVQLRRAKSPAPSYPPTPRW